MSDLAATLGTPRQWARDLAIATGIGVFLGVIGPFGSFNGGPLAYRLAYWLPCVWIGLVGLSVLIRLSLRAAERLDLPDWFTLPLAAAVGAAPLSLIYGAYSARFWPANHGHAAPMLITFGQTLALAEPVSFAYYFLFDGRAFRGSRGMTTPAAASAGFLDRLPARLGKQLLCLQMEDHYVRAHTNTGSDLVLLPLKAAIAELGGLGGVQVHRSWWVAADAVETPIVKGRNTFLRLTNGLEVPVSRASIAKIRAMGWLGPSA